MPGSLWCRIGASTVAVPHGCDEDDALADIVKAGCPVTADGNPIEEPPGPLPPEMLEKLKQAMPGLD